MEFINNMFMEVNHLFVRYRLLVIVCHYSKIKCPSCSSDKGQCHISHHLSRKIISDQECDMV